MDYYHKYYKVLLCTFYIILNQNCFILIFIILSLEL